MFRREERNPRNPKLLLVQRRSKTLESWIEIYSKLIESWGLPRVVQVWRPSSKDDKSGQFNAHGQDLLRNWLRINSSFLQLIYYCSWLAFVDQPLEELNLPWPSSQQTVGINVNEYVEEQKPIDFRQPHGYLRSTTAATKQKLFSDWLTNFQQDSEPNLNDRGTDGESRCAKQYSRERQVRTSVSWLIRSFSITYWKALPEAIDCFVPDGARNTRAFERFHFRDSTTSWLLRNVAFRPLFPLKLSIVDCVCTSSTDFSTFRSSPVSIQILKKIKKISRRCYAPWGVSPSRPRLPSLEYQPLFDH